jgi:DNA uptake protein ComE-like DNA-binding protein
MSRNTFRSVFVTTLVAFGTAFTLGGLAVHGQVGQGLVDFNTATADQLAALPNMSPAAVKAVTDGKPFMSVVDLHKALMAAGLTAEQTTELYGKAFVHVNLNTGTREEILLIPGAGARMVREFNEYRPWVNWAQFDKEISKYVGMEETNRLKQYVFIPVNLNTATDEDILSIPGAGRRMVREFNEYRPWTSQAQFEKEIGKYVDAKEVARLWRYVVIK